MNIESGNGYTNEQGVSCSQEEKKYKYYQDYPKDDGVFKVTYTVFCFTCLLVCNTNVYTAGNTSTSIYNFVDSVCCIQQVLSSTLFNVKSYYRFVELTGKTCGICISKENSVCNFTQINFFCVFSLYNQAV